jgi:hypothetical protein
MFGETTVKLCLHNVLKKKGTGLKDQYIQKRPALMANTFKRTGPKGHYVQKVKGLYVKKGPIWRGPSG